LTVRRLVVPGVPRSDEPRLPQCLEHSDRRVRRRHQDAFDDVERVVSFPERLVEPGGGFGVGVRRDGDRVLRLPERGELGRQPVRYLVIWLSGQLNRYQLPLYQITRFMP